MEWSGKKFHSLNHYYRQKFSHKVIKVSLDAGFTCPNRDGKLSFDGCIFCSKKGSGDFAGDRNFDITSQFNKIRDTLKSKWHTAKYIPYFQAYTNTYAPVDVLREKYYEALNLPDVVGLSIATRPDCLGDDVLELLEEIASKTVLFVELGLQTADEDTAKFLNRRYDNAVFIEATKKLKNIGANVVCHIILGLPNETKEDMLNTVKFAVEQNIDGIKLHGLHVIKNTKLADFYEQGKFELLTFTQYIDIIVSVLEIIPPHIVIHRLTGDGAREDLIAPLYSIKKFHILNGIDAALKDTYQGRNCNGTFC